MRPRTNSNWLHISRVEALEDRRLLASVPELVADVNDAPLSGYPQNLLVVDDSMYFSTEDSSIWRTDGTNEGTIRLSVVPSKTTPTSLKHFTRLGDSVFFASGDYDLWKTDGTAEGTVFVSSFVEEQQYGSILSIAAAGERVVVTVFNAGAQSYSVWSFAASEGGFDSELLVFRDSHPGMGFSALSTLNDNVYFELTEEDGAVNMWLTDGTLDGTRQVAAQSDFGDGAEPYGRNTTLPGGRAIIVDGAGSHDLSLWYFSESAVELRRLTPLDVNFEDIGWVTSAGGAIYFVGVRSQKLELWKSNGLSNDAVRVLVMDDGDGYLNPSLAIGERVYFTGRIAGSFGTFVSDGTAPGTKLIAPLASPGGLYCAADRIYVLSDGQLTSYAFDGSSMRNHGRVYSSNAPTPPRWGFYAAELRSELFLTPALEGDFDEELWRVDAVSGDLVMVANLDPRTLDSYPQKYVSAGDALFFVADDGTHGREVHVLRANGEIKLVTSALQHDVFPSGRTQPVAALGTDVLYAGYGPTDATGNQYGLWSIDGESLLVSLLHPFTSSSTQQVRELTVDGNRAYFVAGSPEVGVELWRSDGTAAGTVVFKDVYPGATGSYPNGLRAADGRLFFEATVSANQRKVFVSDGNSEGTHPIEPFEREQGVPSPFALIEDRMIIDGELYVLTGGTDGTGFHWGLWRTDESEDGAKLIRELGQPASRRRIEGRYDGLIYFTFESDGAGQQLWRSDGTSDGTYPLLVGTPLVDPISQILILDETPHGLAFLIHHGQSQFELWRTAGSEATTERVMDFPANIRPYLYSGQFFSVSGHAFFAANSNATGDVGNSEPHYWVTDGSSENTKPVWENSLRAGSPFVDLTWIHHRGSYFFSAYHALVGKELYRLSLSGDSNFDGRVDLADLNNVRNHFGETGNVLGDSNGDRRVDLADLNAVRNNFGAGNATGSSFRGTAPVAGRANASADRANQSTDAIAGNWQDALFTAAEPQPDNPLSRLGQASRRLKAIDRLFATH